MPLGCRLGRVGVWVGVRVRVWIRARVRVGLVGFAGRGRVRGQVRAGLRFEVRVRVRVRARSARDGKCSCAPDGIQSKSGRYDKAIAVSKASNVEASPAVS